MCKRKDKCKMCFILPGAPRGLGKTGGLIPGINGELPGNCVLPGIGITGVGRTGRRGL